MNHNAAAKRYTRRVIGLSFLYAFILIAAIYAFKYDLVSGVIAYVVAILPALPLIGVFAAIGRYLIDEQDEFVRMLMIRQTLYATAFALSVATIWGFLENFGLVGHVDAYYVAILWFAGSGLGACINKLTLGTAAAC